MLAAVSTHDKALQINMDATKYGTFAEIGAGQEVARWFFRVGGAAGTVAKTISAYDMAVSDVVYGHATRYVSRARLEAMLQCETDALLDQLGASRGDQSTFFVFADTVATRSYSRHEDGEGWLGIRFQTAERGSFSEVMIHVHLLDKDPAREQEALGVLGVNVIHGAFFHYQEPTVLIRSLMDGLTRDRIELDMIKLSGPAFAGVDNRLMTLLLVEQGFTDAAMFTAEGEVVQPSEVLYKKHVLVERGSYRPVTNLTIDLLHGARRQFLEEPDVRGEEPVVLLEMTLRHFASEEGVDHADFLERVDILRTLGHHVMISNSRRYFRFVEFLSRYTQQRIGIALGVPSLSDLAEERDYADLAGGLLEAVARLFKNGVKVYAYPWKDPRSGRIVSADTLEYAYPLQHLHRFLLDSGRVEPIRHYSADFLDIRPREVLAMIQSGDPSWEGMVPSAIVEIIKERRLFGYRPAPGGARTRAGS
jgi:hypothetical protein